MLEVAGRDHDVASPFTAAVAQQGKDPEQHGPSRRKCTNGSRRSFIGSSPAHGWLGVYQMGEV